MGTIDPNSISRNNSPGDAKETARTKSLTPPDSFRKSMDGRSSGKEQEEQALSGKQGKSPSVFDLSSSKKTPSAYSSSIKSPDSPTLPQPKAELASSDEPQFDHQTSDDSHSTSSYGQERYNEARDNKDRIQPQQRNTEEATNSLHRNRSSEDQKLHEQNSKKSVKTTDTSQTTHQIEANEQQQSRIKKQQLLQRQQQNSRTGQTQTPSNMQAGNVRGLKEPSLETPLLGESSEEFSLEKNLNGSLGPKKPMQGDEMSSLVGNEEFNLQFDETLISPNDELSSQFAQLDSPDETIVGEAIQKNVKSEVVAKKEMMERGEKLIAGLEDKVANMKGDQNKDSKTKSQYTEARRIDIEAVPTIQTTPLQTGISADTQQPLPMQTTEELATQIISQIQVLTTKDEMRTTVTLKSPPLLEGATITLTASNNAKKEFNISIANLSPEAKERLDIHLKENSLIDNLSEKGVTVHMLTTSTQPESFVILDDKAYREKQEQTSDQQSQLHERRREQDDEQQQGRQQKRQRKQENEEEET